MNSLKKDTIVAYSLLPNMDEAKDNHVVIVTAAGIMNGTLVEPSSTDDSMKFITTIQNSINEIHAEQSKDSTEVDGNDGYIMLKDVTLVNGNFNGTFKFLTIFIDQIIAISISGNTVDN